MDEERLYIGTKLITASPMDEWVFLKSKGQNDSEREKSRSGYKVTYPDGYVSWSPKEVFEIAYREVTDSEKCLMDAIG